jgi:hypothetical protein
MNVDEFRELIAPVTRAIAGREVDVPLAGELGRRFPADGEEFAAIEQACRDAIAAGWMCREGGEGRRFGRVIEPGPGDRHVLRQRPRLVRLPARL